jgi:endogenous inhibitor of DNA gyrase (YacG/DUF329 family)
MTSSQRSGGSGAPQNLTIQCPTCGKPSQYNQLNPHRPFCSAHCQTGDLAAWASDEYRVPGSANNRKDESSDREPDEFE